MRPIVLSVRFVLGVGCLGLPAVSVAEDGIELFEKKIRPLLAARCEACHSKAKGKTRGGLALDTRMGWQTGGDSGSPIIAGNPDT
ncbi:MAG: c-type cytochrome domain-containing protein, partial [Planctomycetaceae bacterium]